MVNHETIISFPGLGIGEFSVNSVAFSVFGISVAWYGIIIVCGMIVAFAYASWRAKKNEGISFDDMLDYAIFLIIFGIAGARLYYVIFHGGFSSFKELIDLRSGGLAIYGGVIAGAVTAYIVTRVKKLSFAKVADCILPGVMIAQAIGRWGNFMNGEAHGGVTDLPWRMGLRSPYFDSTAYVHPTFLYESLWNVLGFVILNLAYKKKKFDGEIALMYLVWYGAGRAFIEGLRTDSLYIGGSGIRVSQLLAVLSSVAALVMLLVLRHRAAGSALAPVAAEGDTVELNPEAKNTENNENTSDTAVEENKTESLPQDDREQSAPAQTDSENVTDTTDTTDTTETEEK